MNYWLFNNQQESYKLNKELKKLESIFYDKKESVIALKIYQLMRSLEIPKYSLDSAMLLLKTNLFAIIGNIEIDNNKWPELPIDSDCWGERVWANILDIYLRLISNDKDTDIIIKRVDKLKKFQTSFERDYLDSVNNKTSAALELIGLYHLAKIAEILVCNNDDVYKTLYKHFYYIKMVCNHARLVNLESLSFLLSLIFIKEVIRDV